MLMIHEDFKRKPSSRISYYQVVVYYDNLTVFID